MSPGERRGFIPIACRFVPYDQWLLTHLHNDWEIKQVKHWILAKCNLAKPPALPQQRLDSPIIFSPVSVLGRSEDHLLGDDEEYPDNTDHSIALCTPPTSFSVTGGFLADRYILISFSTGTILEDNYSLSRYKLRPYELLEIHRSGIVVLLPREVAVEYVQPYFHARVKALLAVWSHKSGRFKPPGNSTEHEIGHKKRDRSAPRWKPKLEWKDRWVVIHNNILSLSKDNVGTTPRHQFSLATLQVLRGADSLRRACAIVTDQRVVCIKFRTIKSKPGVDTPPVASPSTTRAEDWRTASSKTASDTHSSGSEKPPEKRKFGKTAPRQPYNRDDVCRGEGEWVVLDMLDDHAFANVLRILHRYAPHPISSSFLPSSALGDCCASQVKPFLRESSSAVIPYPEWRVNIVDTAQKVGMGDVGKPMAWVLWPEMGLGGGSFVPNIRKRQQESSQRTSYPPSPISSCSSSDPEFDEYSDDDSELEWDGWTKDLDRQSLVRQHTAGFSKKSYTQSSISSLSSSLPPDHSSGNQSGRVHQVPPTSLNENSSRWNPAQPFSSNELYKTQSSEILSRNSADMARTPEVVIATGINLDSPSSSRRRSATVGPGMLARLAKDVEKISIGQPSATSATSGTPPNLLTVHDVPPFKNPPLRNVRYTQSNSNLFSRPSSEDFANCQREGVLLPLPTVESKHQGSFIRGATKRAERLVRGF